jgi:uncharacterized protein
MISDLNQKNWCKRALGSKLDPAQHGFESVKMKHALRIKCPIYRGYRNQKRGCSMAMLDEKTRIELESAAFRRLLAHLQAHPEVQNIDMMNLSGFCRNCLANWLEEAAKASGVALDRADARAHVYGMPYDAWKAQHQREASAAQQAAFAAREPGAH